MEFATFCLITGYIAGHPPSVHEARHMVDMPQPPGHHERCYSGWMNLCFNLICLIIPRAEELCWMNVDLGINHLGHLQLSEHTLLQDLMILKGLSHIRWWCKWFTISAASSVTYTNSICGINSWRNFPTHLESLP